MSMADWRAFLAFYDEMTDAYHRLNRDRFRGEIASKCAEFRAAHPTTPEMAQILVAMQMHFEARSKVSG